MTGQNEVPAGWLTQFRRGLLSGAGLLLLAVAGCAIPALAVWLVPGADSSPASSAVKSGALIALAAAHGGIRLNGENVTLVPLLVTALLGWLIASQARRSESWSSVVGLTAGYGLAAGLLAGWASFGSAQAPGLSSAVAGVLFAGTASALGHGGAELWDRLSGRHRRIVRAAAAVFCCYLGAGALLVAGSLLLHLSTAIALQHRLAPGVAGLPIALLGIGLAPNAALAGTGYLTGPGFVVGSHTQISILGTSHGRLPSFPLLAAVPSGGPATAVGLVAVAAVAGLAGWLCVRLLRCPAGWPSRLADVMAAAVLAGGALAGLTALGSGGIGSGALANVGARWWAVGSSAMLLVLASGLAWLAVEVLRSGSVAGTEPVRARLRAVAGLADEQPERRSEPGRPNGRATASEPRRPVTDSRPAASGGQRDAGTERPNRTRNVS